MPSSSSTFYQFSNGTILDLQNSAIELDVANNLKITQPSQKVTIVPHPNTVAAQMTLANIATTLGLTTISVSLIQWGNDGSTWNNMPIIFSEQSPLYLQVAGANFPTATSPEDPHLYVTGTQGATAYLLNMGSSTSSLLVTVSSPGLPGVGTYDLQIYDNNGALVLTVSNAVTVTN